LFPVPSEQPVEEEASGTINLPRLESLKERRASKKREVGQPERPRIARGDVEQYVKAIEIDPNADTNLDLFEDRRAVDFVAIALGQGADTFFGIESAYLQLGHVALLVVVVLAAFVNEPTFPLTNSPAEYRDFLKQGLAVTFVINAAVAVFATFEAPKRDQPAWFWAAKSLLIGGVALNQLRTGTGPLPASK